MNSDHKKEKFAAKIKANWFNRKRFFGPSSLYGKRKNGKYGEPSFGPPDATYQFSQQPLHINLEILGKDGRLTNGDLVIKYKVVDIKRYFECLHEWENSIEKLETELGYEINAELGSYGMQHNSNDIMMDSLGLWAEIQNKNGITFRELGIRPYKTFVKWNSTNPIVESTIEQIIEESVTEKNGKLKKEFTEKGEYLEKRMVESEKRVDSLFENSVKGLESTLQVLSGEIVERGSNFSEMYSDLEKSHYQNKELIDELKKDFNENISVLENVRSEVVNLKNGLNELNGLKKEVAVLIANRPDKQNISNYFHDKSIQLTMSNPTRYNANGRGPEFIDEFIKEGSSIYEELTNPKVIIGEEVLKLIAKRAYEKVYGDRA